MAYFDSSKNRALWEIRLKELRTERAARASGERKNQIHKEKQPAELSGSRVRTSYKELLAEEAKSVQSRKRGPAPVERSKSREKGAAMEHRKEAGL